MKVLGVSLFLLTTLSALAQEKPSPLPKPAGWGTEEFALPPQFAPSITYKGLEELRFAPGWADTTKAGYWTYTFAWLINGPVTTNADTLRRQLIAYYDGLYLSSKKTPPEGYDRQFTQARVTDNLTWPGDVKSWTGKVYTYNMLNGRQLDLLLRIHLRRSADGKRNALLFEASPKAYSDAVWKEIDAIIAGFKFL